MLVSWLSALLLDCENCGSSPAELAAAITVGANGAVHQLLEEAYYLVVHLVVHQSFVVRCWRQLGLITTEPAGGVHMLAL